MHTSTLQNVFTSWRASLPSTHESAHAAERADEDGQASDTETQRLVRPLLTGIPPRPLYTHPDVQIALIKAHKREEELHIEPVVVCPAHLREGGWTLERLSGVFGQLPVVERAWIADVLDSRGGGAGSEGNGQEILVHGKKAQELDREKRVLLAIVEDDSTVVFYWIHDGLVKPRQN